MVWLLGPGHDWNYSFNFLKIYKNIFPNSHPIKVIYRRRIFVNIGFFANNCPFMIRYSSEAEFT